MKDYYKLLEVAPDVGEEEIRKAYRRLALRYHPDRNPGDSAAEERFKEIAEAYGVLTDPAKRGEYERLRTTTGHRPTGGNFGYSQEEILRDLFRDPRFSQMFQDLFREFQGAGFRFDERFFNQTFFGGRGRVFGGVFIWKPFEGVQQERTRPARPQVADQPASTPLPPPLRLLKRLGRKVSGYLFGQPKALPETSSKELDLNYDFTVSSAINREGGWVQIDVPRNSDLETLKVRIPPGIRNNTRLRLKGKGRQENSTVGDLYLTIHFS